MVAYRNLDSTRFAAHMNYEHGAYFDMEFLLAACLMDEEERKAVRNVMELKHKAQQEKAKEGEERRGEKRPFVAEQEERAPPPPIPRPVPVKEEVTDEVRVLPEQWEGSKIKPSFSCSVCDKTFLLQKYLQAHQKKAHQTQAPQKPPTPAPTPSLIPPKPQEEPPKVATPEWKCSQCQYIGSRERDLRLHVTKKHGDSSASPSPPAQPMVRPSSPPDSLFSSLKESWAKKKEAKIAKIVKEEPEDPSLQELTMTGTMEAEDDPDDPTPVLEGNPGPVEDTTFVAIQTEGSALTQGLAGSRDLGSPTQVDISKSKYFKANPQTVNSQVEGKLKDQYNVLDDKLPGGWKVKEIQHELKSGRKETKRHYLTPDNKALKTGLAVLEYMRLSGKYSAKEIMDYAKYLAVPVNRLEKYMELYL